LEKIEMKKTLVAVAAIAAFSAAQAEVTLSGGIDYGFQTYTTGTTKTHSVGGDTNQFNNVAFSAGEDLGNGMKASAKYDLGLDYSAGAGGGYTREAHVDLSGAFGSVSVGRLYNPVFLAATVDPIGLPALSIGQEALNTIFLTQTARDVRANGAMSFMTPSFSGLTANYFTAIASTSAARTINKAAATATNANGYTTGYGLKYAAGAFGVEYQTQSSLNEGVADYGFDAIAGTNSNWVTGTTTTKRTVAAAKYDAGFANLAYINGSAKNSNISVTTNYFAVGIPVPSTNFTVSAGMSKGTDNVSATGRNGTAKVVGTTGSIYKANYAFSKRTNAYFIYGSDKADSQGAGRTTTSSSIGLSHNF